MCEHPVVAVGRSERYDEIRPRVIELFGADDQVLGRVGRVFELLELAWHDCYGETNPPAEVVEDVLACSRGTIDGLIDAAHLAVVDRRDLHIAAEQPRT